MKRLKKLNKGETKRIKRALDLIRSALKELEGVLIPIFALEEAPTPAIHEERLSRTLMEALMLMLTMDSLLQAFLNMSSVVDILLEEPRKPKRPVGGRTRETRHIDPARIDWDKARHILSIQEFGVLEYHTGARGKARTLKDISKDFGLSKQRIWQIKDAAQKKLDAAGLIVR